MMHERSHSHSYDLEEQELITEENSITQERRDFLMKEAISYLKRCKEYGCHAYVDTTIPLWRVWPSFYVQVS